MTTGPYRIERSTSGPSCLRSPSGVVATIVGARVEDERVLAVSWEMWDVLRRYAGGEFSGADVFRQEAQALVDRADGLRG